ncbi:MAG: hypothetical protein ABIZ57_03710 [Candidatus Limnocylindria bacterium]
MTDSNASDQNVSRAIRSWLHEDLHEDASRIAGAVLDHVEATPRRRSTWWPARRTPTMNKIVTLGLGAAAVVVALVVSAQFLGSPGGTGGPGNDPSPSPEASVADRTPEPSAVGPTDFAAQPISRLEEGDYVFTHLPGVRVIFTASSNWERNIPNWVVWSIDDNKARMEASTVDNVVIDPCQPDLGFKDPAVGPTVDDLVTALGAVPGLTFSAPADVTQDGYSGVRLDYVPPGELDNCLDDMGEAILMSVDGSVPAEHGFISAPNGADAVSLYIYDVDGTRVVITAAYTENRTDELDEMLASIRFEQP